MSIQAPSPGPPACGGEACHGQWGCMGEGGCLEGDKGGVEGSAKGSGASGRGMREGNDRGHMHREEGAHVHMQASLG